MCYIASMASLQGGAGGAEITLGIVTISDRASAGQYEDLSGPAVLNFYHEAIKTRSGLYSALPSSTGIKLRQPA